MDKQAIIVVGAGISGLYIARELSAHYRVIVLDASERIGGRIFSKHEQPFGGIVEYGAEFIHGNAKKTLKLLKQAGLTKLKVGGKMYRAENGQLHEQEDMVEGWDKLLEKMKTVQDDIVLSHFLDLYFPGDEYAALRKQAINYAEGFDLADSHRVTVKSLYNEWKDEEGEMYRIREGYGTLVNYLAAECIERDCLIITGTLVNEVQWEKDNLKVKSSNGKIYEAHKLVITVPPGVLKRENGTASIRFTPRIDEYHDAIQNIGWGQVIKILLEFDEVFWKKDAGFIFSDEVFPTWWTQLPDERPLWTGWVGGPGAKELSVASDDELFEKALDSFSNVIGVRISILKEKLTAYRIINWQSNGLAQGGYSYSIPLTEESRQRLNTPVENTIYFAGEGYYGEKHPGTVEAALLSAEELLEKITKP